MTAALAATAPLRGLGQARHGVGHQERARAPPRGQLTLNVPAHACPPPGDGEPRGGSPRGHAPPRAPAGPPERARKAWRGGRGQGAWPGGKHPLTMWPEVELWGMRIAHGFFKGKAGGRQLGCDLSELGLV